MLAVAALAAPATRLAGAPEPVVTDRIKDRFVPAPLDRQRIEGLLGRRMQVNLEGRLLRVDEAALLIGFEKPPGPQPWIGEHIGKFLDAASRTWAYTGDERIKLMLDRMAHNLIAMQYPDGYLGTYTAAQRWTSWDVWVHKYCLIGLLSYYQVSGEAAALAAARKAADLLLATFGDGPGQRDILRSGTHMGMAATSVLEPMCVLYRYTGDERYLAFARYLVRSWNGPNGPRIIRTLAATGSVASTANAKAYEMMSNLVGLVELYRITGEPLYLKTAQTAWRDIATRRLYLTGTTSSAEHFRGDFDLPGEQASNVGEGCATVTWLQLTWHLLRVTGEPEYADQLERTVYNQLLGAQDPATGNICYFTPLVGRKQPGPGVNCCVSSEPRGISMIPQLAWGTREGGPAVLFYAPGEAAIPLRADYDVTLASKTEFPRAGEIALTLRLPQPGRFPIFLRVPAWTARFSAEAGGRTSEGQPGRFLRLERMWRDGDIIRIDMDVTARVVPGGPSYPDSVAVERGPQVLALEAELNPEIPHMHRAALATSSAAPLQLTPAELPKGWDGNEAWSAAGIFAGKRQPLVLVPFADAVNYRVWLLRPDRIPVGPVPATAFGIETWSRDGSVPGSICDDRPDTYRTTFEGRAAREDWYAVQIEKPATIARIVYRHGKVFENGG
ncbi:MAG TPA: beta-L-arabinofuranosidase domain-containing protein, partial [Bryobacteraceae bacterium]|nr:beta-L-arabinofuranosidase domain-containing protein [Bryobacteraceae bacterium]